MTYKIVSDSASNLFALQDVEYASVALKIINDSREYADTPELDVAEMIQDLKKSGKAAGTSCPNSYEWLQAYGDADRVFAVTVSGRLSGSCSSARQAAEEWKKSHPDGKIFVVDSLSAGGEMLLIIERIRDGILAGSGFEQICADVEAYRKHLHLLFSLQSLTNLARNGRINPMAAKIAGVMGIRVLGMATEEGTIEPIGKNRGERKALCALYAAMKERGFAGNRVNIAHCLNEELAEDLKRMILAEYPECRVDICPCGGLCGFYAEEGGMVVGFEDAGA